MNNKIVMSKENLKDCIIESIVDGPGVRLAIFFQGCNHFCKGCHNQETWNINDGFAFDIEDVSKYIVEKYKKHKYYSGITLTGGDPLFQDEQVYKLVKTLREEIPNLNIWCYTGYTYSNAIKFKTLSLVNAVVDGKYIEELKDLKLQFRGSSNQNIIDLSQA